MIDMNKVRDMLYIEWEKRSARLRALDTATEVLDQVPEEVLIDVAVLEYGLELRVSSIFKNILISHLVSEGWQEREGIWFYGDQQTSPQIRVVFTQFNILQEIREWVDGYTDEEDPQGLYDKLEGIAKLLEEHDD